MIKIYPNGNTNNAANQFRVFVQLLSMPSSWNNIIVRLTMQCKELNAKCIMTASYLKKTSINKTNHCWADDTLSFNEFTNANPNKLTFSIKIKILQIIGKDPVKSYSNLLKYQSSVLSAKTLYKTNWSLCPKQICELSSQWLPKKRISSDIIGDMFNIYFVPNQCKMVLEITGSAKANIDAVQVKWTLFVPEIDIRYSVISKLTPYSYLKKSSLNNSCSLLIPSLTLSVFKEFSDISFVSEIEILNEYDNKGNIIGISVEDEWSRYLKKPDPVQKATKMTKFSQKRAAKRKEKMNKEKKCEAQKTEQQKQKIKEVQLWLKNEVDLEQYFDILVKNGYDSLDAMSTAKCTHLKKIGISAIDHKTCGDVKRKTEHERQSGNKQSFLCYCCSSGLHARHWIPDTNTCCEPEGVNLCVFCENKL